MITAEVYNRVFFIKIEQYGTGTAIDHNGKQYLVTARHLLEDNEKIASLKFFYDDAWFDLEVEIVGIGSGEVDIAIFSPRIQLCPPSFPLSVGSGGIIVSQDVFFLGFPYKMSTKGGAALMGRPCPFIRKGILSSLFDNGYGVPKLYIDAINNEGFSGGPIIFINQATKKPSVAGIISKFKIEHEKVLCEQGEDTGWSVAYNTGLTIAYDISEAIKIIEKNPKGLPLQT